MRAVVSNVDFRTGVRAVGERIYSRSITHPTWQNIERGWELRLIRDEDENELRGKAGIEFINLDAVDRHLREAIPTRTSHHIVNNELMVESIRQKDIKLARFQDDDTLLANLKAAGAFGITETVIDPVGLSVVEAAFKARILREA